MKKIRKILILAITLFSFACFAEGQERALTQYQLDSLDLVAYQKKVVNSLHDSTALPKCDTFFVKAGKLGNVRWQAVAMAYKVDYWYILHQEDSLLVAVDRAQKFAKAHNQPLYYYFVWKRKITFYINGNKFNFALNEMNLMLEDAVAAGFYPAQVDAFTMMGRIYFAREMPEEAKEYYEKAIALMEAAPDDADITNRFTIYNGYAQMCMGAEKFDEMKAALDKSAQHINNLSYNKGALYIGYYHYYAKTGDFETAKHYLKLADSMDYPNQTLNGALYLLEAKYDSATIERNPRLAIKIVDSMVAVSNSISSINSKYIASYERMGDYRTANAYLHKEVDYKDSIRKADMRNDVSEMMVLMDVNKVKAEKAKLELEMKSRMLSNTIAILIIIAAAFIIAAVVLIRYFRINRKLGKSQDDLNKALAKVEEESSVKSNFLNQLSHEIRTPLNSIVGFSEAITESVGMNKEYSQYSDFINESSSQLIKMVNDAAEMSDYDMSLTKVETDINSCYRTAIELNKIKPHAGVQLSFEPYVFDGDPCLFMIDKAKVVKILANLLHNSAKFTLQGEIVVVASVDSLSQRITFTVTDTGPGIPRESQDYVFENFAKLDPMSQGLGLGLSLSRLLAQSMDGTLTIDPEYTSGCRMVFSFPY